MVFGVYGAAMMEETFNYSNWFCHRLQRDWWQVNSHGNEKRRQKGERMNGKEVKERILFTFLYHFKKTKAFAQMIVDQSFILYRWTISSLMNESSRSQFNLKLPYNVIKHYFICIKIIYRNINSLRPHPFLVGFMC